MITSFKFIIIKSHIFLFKQYIPLYIAKVYENVYMYFIKMNNSIKNIDILYNVMSLYFNHLKAKCLLINLI